MSRVLRTFGHALSELRAHPGRALLSAFSLWIGVLAVVAIFTVSHVVDEGFVAVSEQANGREVTAQGHLAPLAVTPVGLRRAMAAGDLWQGAGGGYALVATPHSSTTVGYPSDAAFDGPLTRQRMIFVAGDLARVRRLPLLAGRLLDTHADLPAEILMNIAAARRWGGVGTRLVVAPATDQRPIGASVVGVISDGEAEPNVYLSMLAVLTLRPTSLNLADIEVLVHDPGGNVPLMQHAAETIAAAAGGRLSGRVDRSDVIAALRSRLHAQQTAFLWIAVLALLISAVGMLNIGLASVAERARELVIRRAVGATRTAIMSQMVFAALIAGVLAAAAAIAVAAAVVAWWVPSQIDPASAMEPPAFPWDAAVWGLSAAVVTTLLGAAIPAIVAARLDVAAALRD